MLDKVHTAINSPTSEQIFNMEEVLLTVRTSISLQQILADEVQASDRIYSGGMALLNL
jgi:hypothetical protein